MFPKTALSKLLGIEYPIIQAPMAGVGITAELVAAVSNAGGLGSIAGGMLSPDAIRKEIAELRARTQKAFSLNLFVLERPKPDPEKIRAALELLRPIREELGLPPGEVPSQYCEDPAAQFEAVLEAKPAVASFTFGVLKDSQVAALKAGGTRVIGTATTVEEAHAWEAVGADAICAQGSEAGAHRGTFLGDFEAALVGTMALVPQIVDAVRVPVIAAGGIMDGRGIAASLMLGAAGVQMGTAFLTCSDSGVMSEYKNLLRHARDDQTRVSRIYSGKHARGLVNEFMRRLAPLEREIPAYPIQNALTGPIRQAAKKAGQSEFMSLWAGQGAGMSRGLTAGELVATLVRETEAALERVAGNATTDEHR
jgi:nitronate monooxygenase